MRADKLLQLKRSPFRRKFHLSRLDRMILEQKGMEKIREDAKALLSKTLQSPSTDARVPYNGHPVFTAQHATATCCRECLFKWHRIPVFRELTEKEIEYLTGLVVRWIEKEHERHVMRGLQDSHRYTIERKKHSYTPSTLNYYIAQQPKGVSVL